MKVSAEEFTNCQTSREAFTISAIRLTSESALTAYPSASGW